MSASLNTQMIQRDMSALIHSLHNDSVQRDGLMWVKGEGCELIDADGRRYIDALSGLWNVTLGHGQRALVEAREQVQAAEDGGVGHDEATRATAATTFTVAWAVTEDQYPRQRYSHARTRPVRNSDSARGHSR